MAGYDVWLGNNRGNIYCRKHIKYTTSDKEFFDYSFYEMGKYDLPAMIDRVLNETGEERLAYIGNSLGSTQMFSALAEGHVNSDKLEVYIALAPVARLDHTTNKAFVALHYNTDLAQWLTHQLGWNEFYAPQLQEY